MLSVKKYKTSQFRWEPAERCFFVSMAQLVHFSDTAFGPLADNRHGFVMASERTGNEIVFRIFHVNWSADDQIMSWVLVPSPADISADPSLKDIQCIIYND